MTCIPAAPTTITISRRFEWRSVASLMASDPEINGAAQAFHVQHWREKPNGSDLDGWPRRRLRQAIPRQMSDWPEWCGRRREQGESERRFPRDRFRPTPEYRRRRLPWAARIARHAYKP